jgi:hypothetical protein
MGAARWRWREHRHVLGHIAGRFKRPRAPMVKSFLVLFFKKQLLSSVTVLTPA